MSIHPLIIGVASLIGFFAVPFSAAAAGSDLVVSMQGPSSAQRGQIIQYTATIANNGPDGAAQVRLTSGTPSALLFEPYYSDGRCNAPSGSIGCNLGYLPSGTVTRILLGFTVRPLTTSSCSPMTASVTVSLSGGSDAFPSNNSTTVRTQIPCPPRAECNDGIDNDRDGAVDYGRGGNADFGCLSANDRDERYPLAACYDGRDNDGDGRIDFPQDPGCSSRQDNDEFNPAPPAKPRVSAAPLPSPPPSPSRSPSPPPQSFSYSSSLPPPYVPFARTPSVPAIPQGRMPWLALPIPRCYQEEEGPGYVEDLMIDLRCEGSKWAGLPGFEGYSKGRGGSSTGGIGGTMGSGSFACNDGQDNDGDGRTDFPADPDCSSPRDPSENAVMEARASGRAPEEASAPCTETDQIIIEHTTLQQEVVPGSVVRFTTTVRNTSTRLPLTNSVLLNRLPPGTIAVALGGGLFDGRMLRWNIPRINPGAVYRTSYNVRVPTNLSHGDRFGGAISLDGGRCLVSIRDQGSVRVVQYLPKTGVDLSLLGTAFWILLVSASVGSGWWVGRRQFSSP